MGKVETIEKERGWNVQPPPPSIDFKGKRILLACHALRGFTGSEMHLLELAGFFQSQGADVTCLAFERGEPMASEFERLGVRLIGPWQIGVLRKSWDLVWTHHDPVFLWLHCVLGVRANRHLHGLLSTQAKIERVPLVPAQLASDALTFLANSTETKDHAGRVSGRSDIGVMPNFVPEAYFEALDPDLPMTPARIAIVSNHVPPELLEARGLLADQGIDVTIFGHGHTYMRITPEALQPFDAIVTIGKTVQYALAAGLPVFVYDRFGGPGYMQLGDIDVHEAQNFSGRSDPRLRTAAELAQEIVEDYAQAAQDAPKLRTTLAPKFAIKRCVSGAVAQLDGSPGRAMRSHERLATLKNHLLRRPRPFARMLAPKLVARFG